MKSLLAVFVCAASLGFAQTQTVDVLFTTPANGYSVGDSVSTTMLGYAVRSTGPTANFSGTGGAILLNADMTATPYYKFKVGSTTYDLSSAQGWKVLHDSSANVVQLGSVSQSGAISVGYLLYTNVNRNDWAGAHQRIDYSVITGNTGSSAYDNYQIYANATLQRGHHIETDAGDSIVPTSEWKTYWITMIYTPGNPGSASVSVYDAVTWALVGTSTRAAPVAATLNGVHFGSDAATSNFAGKYSLFKAVVVDLSGKFPLGVPEAPTAPSSLAAGTPTTTTIPLTWALADTKAQCFQVFRSIDNSNFALVASTADDATGYTDTGLDPGRKYYYKVRAHNISYDSAFASTVNATTAALSGSGATVTCTTLTKL